MKYELISHMLKSEVASSGREWKSAINQSFAEIRTNFFWRGPNQLTIPKAVVSICLIQEVIWNP